MYAGNQLIQLLQKQHEARGNSGLFQTGIFTVLWRAKVGSFPHPDGETIISAGEPCGAWRASYGRPEDKRNVGENLKQLRELPLNGYIPGSAIRGLVRSWAKQRPEIQQRMRELLGYQQDNTISAGKIEFLDAWPKEPTKLTLDIVNPQEPFQVFHEGQSTPLSFYAFGDGENAIELTVAIRGIPGKANAAEVAEVWEWVQQALTLYGVGSRTASGYGAIASPDISKPTLDSNYPVKTFNFSLYSQGCYGADPPCKDNDYRGQVELRPSHWRGWLRSWVLRFLLGVMSERDAKTTLGELFGVLEPDSCKGCVRSQMIKEETWGARSANQPYFYTWKGKLQVSAPKDILNKIILPIIRFAVMVGGLGRGWRRPLHIFVMNNGRDAARGTYLTLTHPVKNPDTKRIQNRLYGLPLNESNWTTAYQDWLNAVQLQWPNRFSPDQNPQAEVFSPTTCAVYILPDPQEEPVDKEYQQWSITQPLKTRGCGMDLIYQPKYKRKIDVGGDAGNDSAHCSWASIKRVNISNKIAGCECQEVVCLFAGGIAPNSRELRADFLRDLGKITNAVHLFGLQPSP